MTVLGSALRVELLDALLRLPGIEDQAVRSVLLDGIPPVTRTTLHRNSNPYVDLSTVMRELEGLGRFDNGERPVVILANNAARMSRGTDLSRELVALIKQIEDAYGGEPPASGLPDHPEILPFGGEGDWVSTAFLRYAHQTGNAVARLRVPRYEGGTFRRSVGGVGTGWLVGPGLMLTNHHVVSARVPGEPAVSDKDFELQGLAVVAWFDYHVEGGEPVTATVTEVVATDASLDYALLRLADAARPPLTPAASRPDFRAGMRLNIVQCPAGGPLRYAIRSNYFAGMGDRPELVRYVTDTLQGSSGAPVLDDDWQVVAMHRGYRAIDPATYVGDASRSATATYLNEGIVISDILADLPSAVRHEIQGHQPGVDGRP